MRSVWVTWWWQLSPRSSLYPWGAASSWRLLSGCNFLQRQDICAQRQGKVSEMKEIVGRPHLFSSLRSRFKSFTCWLVCVCLSSLRSRQSPWPHLGSWIWTLKYPFHSVSPSQSLLSPHRALHALHQNTLVMNRSPHHLFTTRAGVAWTPWSGTAARKSSPCRVGAGLCLPWAEPGDQEPSSLTVLFKEA